MRKDILMALRGLAEVYEKTLTEGLIKIWDRVLSDVSEEELASAVERYLKGPDSNFFPKPGTIYSLAKAIPDLETEAAWISEMIFTSVRLYGGDPIGTERARIKIGSVGWAYVISKGGWETIRTSVKSDDDIPIFQAQTRKALIGLIQRRNAGKDLIPKLDQPKIEGLVNLGDFMPSIKKE